MDHIRLFLKIYIGHKWACNICKFTIFLGLMVALNNPSILTAENRSISYPIYNFIPTIKDKAILNYTNLSRILSLFPTNEYLIKYPYQGYIKIYKANLARSKEYYVALYSKMPNSCSPTDYGESFAILDIKDENLVLKWVSYGRYMNMITDIQFVDFDNDGYLLNLCKFKRREAALPPPLVAFGSEHGVEYIESDIAPPSLAPSGTTRPASGFPSHNSISGWPGESRRSSRCAGV